MLSLYSIYNHEHVHTVSSVDITISVLSATLTVTCTASGGTVVGSSLTGPGEVDLQLRPVGSIGRTGHNSYSVTSGTLSGRSDGDTYRCTATDKVSLPVPSDITVLRGIHVYIILGNQSIHNIVAYPIEGAATTALLLH